MMKRKRIYASLLVLISGLSACPTKAANPADYPVKVHVASSELKSECSSDVKGSTCAPYQMLTVTIEAKRYTLESSRFQYLILPPGDYQARITKDDKKASSQYSRQYELIFPDGTTVKYDVVGESE